MHFAQWRCAVLMVLVMVLCTLGGLWTSTQWTAALLGYQLALGTPWVWVRRYPVYPPQSYVIWMTRWGASSPAHRAVFDRGRLPAFGGAVSGVLVVFLVSLRRRKRLAIASTFGTTRFALPAEVVRAKLCGKRGVVLGKCHNRSLMDDEPGHVMVCGPTRSSKGVSTVVPTCLTWPEHLIVTDPKAELFAVSSGIRAQFSAVFCFDPTRLTSHRYNFLDSIDLDGPYAVRDAQILSRIINDPQSVREESSHWNVQAQNLCTGAILFVKLARPEKTLAEVVRLLSDPARSLSDTFKDMLACPHAVVAGVAREMLDKSDRELSGIVSTLLGPLGIFRDPIIARNTSVSDFRSTSFHSDVMLCTLYIITPPSDQERSKLLARMLLHQIGSTMTETLHDNKHVRTLMLLDEFTNLGHLAFYEQGISFLAGFGVKLCLVIQSLDQLEKVYGPNNSIIDNCRVKVFYAPNSEKTAKRLSDFLGVKTNLRQQQSLSGGVFSPFFRHKSIADQESQRPLLTPDEVMRLPNDDAIIIVSGTYPIRAKKNRYYDDPHFSTLIVPPVSLDIMDDVDDVTLPVPKKIVTSQPQSHPYHERITPDIDEEDDEDDGDERFKGIAI